MNIQEDILHSLSCPLTNTPYNDIEHNNRVVAVNGDLISVYDVEFLYQQLKQNKTSHNFTQEHLKEICEVYRFVTADDNAPILINGVKEASKVQCEPRTFESKSLYETQDLTRPVENLTEPQMLKSESENVEQVLRDESIQQLCRLLKMDPKNIQSLCPTCIQTLMLHVGELSGEASGGDFFELIEPTKPIRGTYYDEFQQSPDYYNPAYDPSVEASPLVTSTPWPTSNIDSWNIYQPGTLGVSSVPKIYESGHSRSGGGGGGEWEDFSHLEEEKKNE